MKVLDFLGERRIISQESRETFLQRVKKKLPGVYSDSERLLKATLNKNKSKKKFTGSDRTFLD